MVISKITPGLRYEKNEAINYAGYYYFKKLLVKKGDLEVKLDAPLTVIGEVLVDGNIIAPNGITAARRLEARGGIKSDGIVSVGLGQIKTGGDLEADGIVADGNIMAGNNIKANYIECAGTMKANGNIEGKAYIACTELIYAGLGSENAEESEIRCAELRNGEVVTGTLVITGEPKIANPSSENPSDEN